LQQVIAARKIIMRMHQNRDMSHNGKPLEPHFPACSVYRHPSNTTQRGF
jgi:hypothetical protein